MDLKGRILEFLYEQVQANQIPHIRKGLVESLEQFVIAELAAAESARLSEKMRRQAQTLEEPTSEENSKQG